MKNISTLLLILGKATALESVSMSGALENSYLSVESLLIDKGEKITKSPLKVIQPKPHLEQKVLVQNNTSKFIKKQIGRDQHGLFKDHQSFVKVRNQVNSDEDAHRPMYQAILDKIQNEDFLQQALQNQNGEPVINMMTTQQIVISNGVVAKQNASASANATANATAAKPIMLVSTKSPVGMNEDDMKCYSDRYSDVGTEDPREHFTMIGRDQGRLATCARNASDIEAQRLIDRYPFLQHQYGRKGKYAVMMSRDNYTNYGYKEKVKIQPDYWEEPWFCGDIDPANPNYSLSCGCSGRLWMGAVKDQVTGNRLNNFEELRHWKTVSKDTSNEDWTDCSVAAFGADPWPGKKKQCWCEVKPYDYPTRCANDGEDCMCNGNVYYGGYEEEGKEAPIDFWTMTGGFWTINSANNTKNISCSPKSFEDVDPMPGLPKQCYCDENKLQSDEATVQYVKDYWRNVMWERWASEQRAQAAAEAEAARAQAEADAAQEAAMREAERIAQEAAELKARQEEEAARLKAEQEAKAAEELRLKNLKIAEEAAKKEAAEAAARKAAKEKAEAEAKAAWEKAEAEKDARERARLMEIAKKDKEAAVKAAIAAALAEERARRDEEQALMESKLEQERIERERLQKEAEAKAKQERLIAEEKARKAKEEEEAARKKAQAEEKAALAEAHKLALEKAVADAIEAQRLAFEAKEKKAAEEKAKLQKIEDERQAKLKAQREREEAAAAEAKRLAEEEAARLKAQLEAEEKAQKEREAAELAEERALEKEAYEKAKKEQEARDALIAAQRAQELAQSKEDQEAAEAAAAAAQKAFDEAEAERKRVLAEKKAIEDQLKAQQIQMAADKLKAEEAAARAKEAEESAANSKKAAAEAKAKAEAEMKEAERKKAEHLAKLEAEQKAAKAKQEAQLLVEQEAFKKSQEAQKLAHEAAEQARKELEQKQIAEHAKAMAERRSSFEAKFRNVWSTGPTGVSLVQYTVETLEGAENLITTLFRKTLIADVEEYKSNLNRAYLSPQGAMVPIMNLHKIVMVTSDDRVAELIEEVAAKDPNHFHYPAFDVVVTPLATGSKEYIQWVKTQTLKKDPSTAFFNEQINEPMEPLNNTIPDINSQMVQLPAKSIKLQIVQDESDSE